ncbi:Predicted unusual protein kinase regulating ubiquinone biosynthesis, AarF/ABC1/UbiB family [Halogeometricum rufum]|uniref:Predicted unusual protein kinase regulating ubiquinone biosynthesis, AarF/ABC1/UbiB family n=1 Tax=Halogeometricum rufum TaxID=553469 RepID=A0A1I6I2P8_9EURY|nr:AarF/ABC1/UbiB kinase family protein [Halogeometricum rufum]MUV56703.1 AarF/ABC1/UbiB kinase family protein [Halogeometricum sp. CBA1124]SFR60965.1 Predicted unusual protein kinase regulating ubiquinone biosynthesis, AarF/ABC1/UbiB family [Halogeometricum rufum]
MVTLVNLRSYWRFLVVVYQFFPLIVAYARDRRKYLLFGGRRTVTTEMQAERAQILLDSLLTLGPTFIKLGQLLSTRPDILPPQYIEVLSSLQDDVPPAPWSDAKQVLEEELGPIDEAFASFDDDPISGASLGQVYTARYDGEDVAVKVRRPGIESLVEADLRVVRWSLPILMRFIGQGRAFSLENLADEFAKTIRQEMDYGRERRILEQIRSNFEGDRTIRIPDPVEERSGPRVLTMEYLPGTKINDVAAIDEMGVDRTELATRLQRIYLQMIIDDGVFHADPHPGNLAVDEEGRIIFYDFGMSGRVDPFIQDKIVDFYVAVANQNIDGILDALVEMGTLSPEADRQVMGDVMELAIADARGEDIEQYRVQQIIEQVESTIYEFPLRLPRNLALVLRVATVVEGVCVTLDPEFDFISVATDYLREEGYYEETAKELVADAGRQMQRTTEALFTVPPKLDRVLDRVERENLTVNVRLEDKNDVLDKLARRLVYGILLSVGALSTAILYAFDQTSVVPAAVAAALTVPVVVQLYRSFRKKRGLRTTPQFTRQSMRQRRGED